MQVVFSPDAIDDLASIRSFIEQDAPLAASRIAVAIVAACDRLEQLPHRGRPGRVAGTRELATVQPYVIVYRVAADVVEIIRIWHEAQDRSPPSS